MDNPILVKVDFDEVPTEINKRLPNPIEEILDSKKESSEFIEIFQADSDDIDLKTEYDKQEVAVINVISLNASFLRSKGFPDSLNIYDAFAEGYSRYRVSKDRASRKEFVDINKKERFENNLDKFNSIQNLQKVKQ